MDCKTCGTFYEPNQISPTPIQCGVCKAKHDNQLFYVMKMGRGCLTDSCIVWNICNEHRPCELDRMVKDE